MRAFTHISVAAPDYTLRVPSRLRLALAAGGLTGLAGAGLIAADVSPLVGLPLTAVGAASGAAALALGVVTSSRLRATARRHMLEAVAWRGDERVLDVGCGNGFLLVEIAKRLTTGSATGIDLWMPGAGRPDGRAGVAPMLGGAATFLRARALESIERRGAGMALLSAKRPALSGVRA